MKTKVLVWASVLVVAIMFALCSGVSGANPTPAKGTTKINPKDRALMVWMPAGEFIMGATARENAALIKRYSVPEKFKAVFESQGPQHKVYLNGYWIYKYEVTVAQYREFCRATRRQMPDAPEWGWKDRNPMLNVTWNDADAYARWAACSLPTEAQWETAARGTDGRTYPWGNK